MKNNLEKPIMIFPIVASTCNEIELIKKINNSNIPIESNSDLLKPLQSLFQRYIQNIKLKPNVKLKLNFQEKDQNYKFSNDSYIRGIAILSLESSTIKIQFNNLNALPPSNHFTLLTDADQGIVKYQEVLVEGDIVIFNSNVDLEILSNDVYKILYIEVLPNYEKI